MRCACEFHLRAASAHLPVPVLFRPPHAPESSFWVWYVNDAPTVVVAILLDRAGRPMPREFRSFAHACAAAARCYKLPLTECDVRALSACGLVKVPGRDECVRLRDVRIASVVAGVAMLPADCGQSALCREWSDARCEPARKRTRLPPPPASPEARARRPPYDAAAMGGNRARVDALLASFPIWTPEVVVELLHWGATPCLVRLDYVHHMRTYTRVNCTFAQPDGQLVPNVFVPLGLLRKYYPEQVTHL